MNRSDEGSSADEGVPIGARNFCGGGPPVQVGLGYTSRDFCDGQSLAWGSDERQYHPETESCRKYAETFSSARLSVELSLGKVSKSITELKNEGVTRARSHGME